MGLVQIYNFFTRISLDTTYTIMHIYIYIYLTILFGEWIYLFVFKKEKKRNQTSNGTKNSFKTSIGLAVRLVGPGTGHSPSLISIKDLIALSKRSTSIDTAGSRSDQLTQLNR